MKSSKENFVSESREFSDRLEPLDRKQIEAWRNRGPIKRLEMAFQAYQFALDSIRLTERQNHPDLSEAELNWRIVERMQGQKFAQQ
ncbi:MAG: hypothetical protein ONB27_12800 [candidate division KSB1 bacterium]|nr:hypothetical protein [candidate division KSB1 bacterium]